MVSANETGRSGTLKSLLARVARIIAIVVAVSLSQFVCSWSSGIWRLDIILFVTVFRESRSRVVSGLAPLAALAVAFSVDGISWSTALSVALAVAVSLAVVAALSASTRSYRADSVPGRRFGAVFLNLILVVLIGAGCQVLLASASSVSDSGQLDVKLVGQGLCLAVGVFLAAGVAARSFFGRSSEWRLSKLAGAFVALALAALAAQVTISFWLAQDTQALSSSSAAAAATFQNSITSDVAALNARAAAPARTPVSNQASFDRWIKAFFTGSASFSAVSMVEGQAGKYRVLFATDRQGAAMQLSPLMGGDPADAASLDAASANGISFAVAVRDIPTADGSAEPNLIYVAPIVASPNQTVPRLLVVAISLPVTFVDSVAPLGALNQNLSAALVQHVVEPAARDITITQLVGEGAPALTDVAMSSHAACAIGDFNFSTVVWPGIGFGAPLQDRILILGGIGGLGLGAVLLILQAANGRARIRQELEEREGLLSAALDAAPGLVLLADADSKVLVSNAPADTRRELVGRSVIDSMPFAMDQADRKRLTELIAAARLGEPGWIEHIDSITESALSIHVVSASPVESTRVSAAKVVVQVEDVTDQRARAMRTAQSERLRSLGTMAGGLAHDFNNLLFIITGYLQLLQEAEPVAGDEQLARYAERAVDAAERGAEIAASLLAVARSQPLEATAIEVGSFLRLMFPLVRQAVGTERTAILEVGSEQFDVLIDSGQLSSSILNLVINSRDATTSGGTVRVSATRQFVDESTLDLDPQEYVVISVSDDGTGMTAAVVERAFEPYFSTKGAGHGTGIGLAAVHSFARQSGGLASIETELEIGTTVSIYLPAVFRQPSALDEVSESGAKPITRILVVDDEDSLAFLVAGWLTEHGADVRVADNSTHALAVAEEFHPDVLLTDVRLGDPLGVDGPELADKITTMLPEISVVFMTGYSDRMHDLKSRGLATLAKPFTKEALGRVLFPSSESASRDDVRGV